MESKEVSLVDRGTRRCLLLALSLRVVEHVKDMAARPLYGGVFIPAVLLPWSGACGNLVHAISRTVFNVISKGLGDAAAYVLFALVRAFLAPGSQGLARGILDRVSIA